MKQSNRPQQLHNLPSSSEIDWSKYESKNYLHFDDRVNIRHVKKKIQDPNWVSSHAFLPSIHFNISFNKYITKSKDKSLPINERKEKKTKTRQIYYAAHKDRFIYKFYGDMLNNAYNEYAKSNGIDEIAVAYRNNKSGKNNVDFAYEVFEFLFNQEQALIISIDFTKFFDHINHRVLKQHIKSVLDVEKLRTDWYKVYKNLTQFTYVHKSDIDDYLERKYGVKRLKELIKKRKLTKLMTAQEFRTFKKDRLFKHKKPFGIPQGSGMSAVCSNVHLIEFDIELNQWAKKHRAFYRRYCDDLIMVIPLKELNQLLTTQLKNEIIEIIKNYENHGLKIQEEKTEIRNFSKGIIYDEDLQKNTLDYLGFVTDGHSIRIREKSLFKYYSRAYRKANTSKKIANATGRKGPRKKLYKIYTHLGYKYKGHGNFTTYAYRAHKIMNKLGNRSHIRNQVKKHWNKIHKKL